MFGTIPILGTDQQVHSIPQDQLGAALQAGGMPVATVRDPQGQMRYIPSDQVETARAMGGSVVSRAPQSEELDFLQKNPGHTWLARDPQKFPNREEGIYPAGAGNEWRNDPNSPMASNTQAPIDLHLGLHTYQGIKTGLMPVGAALSLGATIPQVVGGVVSGTAGNVVGQKIAQAAGAGPVGQEISGDVGGLIGGIYGANRAGGAAQQFVQNFRTGLNPNPPVYPGAPLPEMPAAEVLNPSLVSPARTLPGMISPESIRPPASPIPARSGLALPGEVAPAALGKAGSIAESVAATPSGAGLPRTLSGESALSQVLSRLDNATLLRIAKSRGINVSQEALLKAGTANGKLIAKILNDFSPDELQNFGAQYLESSRFQHQFPSGMPDEAWSTIATRQYFPETRISQAQLTRTEQAIGNLSPRMRKGLGLPNKAGGLP